MAKAPTGIASHSGQSPAGATQNPILPCIRVLGERHTGTRAIAQMIDALPDITSRPKLGAPKEAREEIRLLRLAAEAEAEQQNRNNGPARQRYLDTQSLAKPLAACWKHAQLRWDDSYNRMAGVILTWRNPYAWLFALFSRPLHQVGPRIDDFDQFIDHPWISIPRERMVPVVSSPTALWTVKTTAALQFKADATIPVSTLPLEPFLADPVAALGGALRALGRAADGLQVVPEHTKTAEPLALVQQRHADDPWRNWLTAGQVARINADLDPQIVEKAGYRMENPKDYPARLSTDAMAGLVAYARLNRRRRRAGRLHRE